MSAISEFANIWSAVKEIDLRPIRIEAERGVEIAIVGRQGAGKHLLADRMRHDLWREDVRTNAPILIVDLETIQKNFDRVSGCDLILLIASAYARQVQTERDLRQKWLDGGKKTLLVINTHQPSGGEIRLDDIQQDKVEPAASVLEDRLESWDEMGVLAGDIADPIFLRDRFIPAILASLPDKLVVLGRNFPLFRVAISRQLIHETSFNNAAYAFSTGLAEIVPVLDIPLNVADMFVLSKNQAFLIYRLGLTMGFSSRWQDYIKEFSGVLGSGFFWRQVARQLVGLIPAWGILPKVAVSYAGTYVVGQAVLQWYLTGRHLNRRQMKQFYAQAFESGRQLAIKLSRRKPGLTKNQTKALPAGRVKSNICSACGKKNSRRAQFCQYCGTPLTQAVNSHANPLSSEKQQ